MAWSIPSAIAAATDRTAAWLNAIMGSLTALSAHTHNNSDGDGATLTTLYPVFDYQSLLGQTYTNSSGGTVQPGTASCITNTYISLGASSLNCYLEWIMCLRAGTYTLTALYQGANNSGTITASFNGASQGGTQDFYVSSTTYNLVATWSNIVIATTGLVTIRLASNSKNGSSAGYNIAVQTLSMLRTGD